jgi:hypothetical protein
MALPPGPRVTKYFDLARPTAEVNAELNSQDATLEPATYRYARVELCKSYGGQTQADIPTRMWQGPGMDAEQPFVSGDCGRTSQPRSSPARPPRRPIARSRATTTAAALRTATAPASTPPLTTGYAWTSPSSCPARRGGSRLAYAGSVRTAKVSIAIDKQQLKRARSAAKAEGLSLSAYIARALGAQLADQRRIDAARALHARWRDSGVPTAADEEAFLARMARPRTRGTKAG